MYLTEILGITVGKKSAIHMGCFFTGNNIIIGDNCVINRNCYFDGRHGIKINNNVGISPEVYILSLTHDINSSNFSVKGGLVVIEDNVWIGVRTIILPGVRIGNGGVIGSGSVVTKNINSFEVFAGVPAKKISTRNSDINYKLSYFPYYDTDIVK
jgi:maltose O-acetyltransferase